MQHNELVIWTVFTSSFFCSSVLWVAAYTWKLSYFGSLTGSVGTWLTANRTTVEIAFAKCYPAFTVSAEKHEISKCIFSHSTVLLITAVSCTSLWQRRLLFFYFISTNYWQINSHRTVLPASIPHIGIFNFRLWETFCPLMDKTVWHCFTMHKTIDKQIKVAKAFSIFFHNRDYR